MRGDGEAPLVRLVDDGLHLLEAHLLLAGLGIPREHAAGGADLDHPRAVLAQLAHALAALLGAVGVVLAALRHRRREVGAVAVAAGGAEGVGGRQDARPRHLALVDGLAKTDVVPRIGAEVADGGEPGLERLRRCWYRQHRPVAVVVLQPVVAAVRWVAVDVHVHVDQARQHGHVAEVEAGGIGGCVDLPAAGGDGGDAAVSDEQLGVVLDAAAACLEQAVGADDRGTGEGLQAGDERQGEAEGQRDRTQRRVNHGSFLVGRCSGPDGRARVWTWARHRPRGRGRCGCGPRPWRRRAPRRRRSAWP